MTSNPIPATVAAVLAVSLLLSSCSGTNPHPSGGGYAPVFATGPPDSSAARGTLKGDYEWARSATEAREAVTRWEQFLQLHEPRSGEYQDGFEKRHVDAAKYELMRAYYLLGERQRGDELLRQLDPLHIR